MSEAKWEYKGKPCRRKGTVVYFYPEGKRAVSPLLAYIFKHDGGGRLMLQVWDDRATTPRYKKNVRFVSDPYLEQNPGTAKTEGAWTWPEDHEAWEDQGRVMRLHSQGLLSAEIADAIGDGMTFQKVNAILDKVALVPNKPAVKELQPASK